MASSSSIVVDALAHAVHQRLGGADFLGQRLERGAALRRFAAAVGLRRLVGLAPLAAVAGDAGHLLAIVRQVAVIGVHRAVLDQPQPVGGRLDQVAVVRDQDHRARKIVERMDQRFAANRCRDGWSARRG